MKLLLSVSLHHLRENSPSALRACCKNKTKQKAGIFNLLAAVNPLRALLLGAEHRIHFQSCTNCNKGSADGSVTSERGRTKASPLTSEKSPLITHINHKAAGDTKTYSTAAHTHTHTQTDSGLIGRRPHFLSAVWGSLQESNYIIMLVSSLQLPNALKTTTNV